MNTTTSPTMKSRSPSGRGIRPEIRAKLHQFKAPKVSVITETDKDTIESALLLALQHVRNAHDTAAIQVATGKTIRAATLLKRACQALKEGGNMTDVTAQFRAQGVIIKAGRGYALANNKGGAA